MEFEDRLNVADEVDLRFLTVHHGGSEEGCRTKEEGSDVHGVEGIGHPNDG
jgi:hypothetical protein